MKRLPKSAFAISVLLLSLLTICIPRVTFASGTALPYRVVILGSSTAAGEAARPLDSSWANKYKRFLSAAVPGSEVVNLATGGFTTFNVMPTGYAPPSPWNTAAYQPAPANNITRALSLSPSLIIVNLPTNDCANLVPTATQIANYDRIVQEAQTQGVPVYITTSQPRNTDPAGRTLLIQMKDLILSRYGSRAIDFWTGFADAGGSILAAYNFDGTHLNTAGHAVLFERVRSTIPTGSTLPPPPPPPSGPGMLVNQGFESGTANWVFYTNAAGTFRTVAPGNGSASAGNVDISSAGTNVQLYQTGFALEAGQQYRLTFQAYSNSGRDVSVTVQQHSPPSTGFGLTDRGFDITPSWQTYSTTFTASGFAGRVTDTRIRFWFAPYAQGGDRYYFDDIVLEKVTAGPSAPIISSHPSNQTVATGQSATFSVSASGTAPLSYQWQRNLASISGAIGASYTTPAAASGDNGSTYRCIITNSVSSATSNAATLTVAAAPPPPPSGQGVLVNQGFESGTGNWVFYTNGSGVFRAVAPGNGSPAAGNVEVRSAGTNIQLYQTGFPLETGQEYRLTFQAYGNSGRDVSVTIQQHSAPYTLFGVADRAFDITPAWQTYSTTFIASGFQGATTDTRLRFWFASYAQAGDQYYLDNVVLEKVAAGPSAPTFSAHPLSQTVAVGQNATFSVSASGTAPLSYQWQKNSANISAATGASYTTPAAAGGDNGSTYRCIVTNSVSSAASNAATLTVTATPPPPPSAQDMPRNPGFELGTGNWVFYTNGSGSFNAVPGGTSGAFAGRVYIDLEGTNVQLYQPGLALQPNTSYTLTFDAYSTSGHDIAFGVQQHGTPYTNYGLYRDVDLGSSWKNYSLTFRTAGFSLPVNDARLMFWLAPQDAGGDTFFFDTIVLAATGAQSPAGSLRGDIVENRDEADPVAFGLSANYPNPFNPATTITYGLPEAAAVSLKIFSMLGQEVASPVNAFQPSGVFRVVWDGTTSGGSPVGSGVYVYRLSATGISGRAFVETKRMVLVR